MAVSLRLGIWLTLIWLLGVLWYLMRRHLDKLLFGWSKNALSSILNHIIITRWILSYKLFISFILIKSRLGHFQILILVWIVHLRLDWSALNLLSSWHWETLEGSWHLIKVSILAWCTLSAKLTLRNGYRRNLLILRVTCSLLSLGVGDTLSIRLLLLINKLVILSV